jgi:hypothetical protein
VVVVVAEIVGEVEELVDFVQVQGYLLLLALITQ